MSTVSIADQIKALVDLQRLDGEIYQLRRRVEAKPAETAALKAEHQKSVQGLQAAEAQHKGLDLKRNQMELDLGEKENQIRKLQGQLFQLKTNKEYTAIQKEIEGLKADKSVLEEEVLKVMDQVEQVKGQLHSERETLKGKEAVLNAAVARIEEEARAIQNSIHELESQRQGLAAKVDRQILGRYDRILKHHEGLALVPVRKQSCGGCNMVLPHQTINEIQMAERLITCESCARILYIDPAS